MRTGPEASKHPNPPSRAPASAHLPVSMTPVHAHTHAHTQHVHTHMHTHMHSHTNACGHTYTCRHAGVNMPAHIYAPIQAHPHMHARTHTCPRVPAHVYRGKMKGQSTQEVCHPGCTWPDNKATRPPLCPHRPVKDPTATGTHAQHSAILALIRTCPSTWCLLQGPSELETGPSCLPSSPSGPTQFPWLKENSAPSCPLTCSSHHVPT